MFLFQHRIHTMLHPWCTFQLRIQMGLFASSLFSRIWRTNSTCVASDTPAPVGPHQSIFVCEFLCSSKGTTLRNYIRASSSIRSVRIRGERSSTPVRCGDRVRLCSARMRHLCYPYPVLRYVALIDFICSTNFRILSSRFVFRLA